MNENISNEEEQIEEVEEQVEEFTEESQEDEVVEESGQDDELERLRKENKTLKIQKAKQKGKLAETELKAPISGDLSTDDLFTLMEAKIPKLDIPLVAKYAKMEGISLSSALESDMVQSMLKEKSNERKVASATNTGSGRRSVTEVTGDDVLANIRKGNSIAEGDIDKMIEARMNRRRK